MAFSDRKRGIAVRGKENGIQGDNKERPRTCRGVSKYSRMLSLHARARTRRPMQDGGNFRRPTQRVVKTNPVFGGKKGYRGVSKYSRMVAPRARASTREPMQDGGDTANQCKTAGIPPTNAGVAEREQAEGKLQQALKRQMRLYYDTPGGCP